MPRLRSIEGRVTDAQGRPVAGAVVWQSGDGPRRTEAMANDEGRFRLEGVYEGPAMVFARHDGFRIHGAVVATAQECHLVLWRIGEPARAMRALPPPVPLAEERKLTMSLVAPLLPMLSEKVFQREHYQLLRTVARADPSRALDIADTVLTNPDIKDIARQTAALALVETDLDEAVEIAALLQQPYDRVHVYLQAVDALAEELRDERRWPRRRRHCYLSRSGLIPPSSKSTSGAACRCAARGRRGAILPACLSADWRNWRR